ncbi:MAG: LamG domain-containing protein [Kiritimatiellia bacterium]|jgi:hypothetical protein|nr:LamG domain-containing protein [Kiritimatiellia bacterium]
MKIHQTIAVLILAITATTVWGQLEHHYTFDVNADDSAGSVDGTFSGDATVNTGGGNPVGGGYLDLDGTGDYVDLANASLTPVGDEDAVTMCVWLQKTNGATVGCLYSETRGGATDQSRFNFQVWGVDGDAIVHHNPGGSWWSVTAGVADGNWHHLAWVQATSGTLREVFVDGVSVGSTTTPITDYTGSAITDVTIGTRLHGSSVPDFQGGLDDMAFWHETLTADEMKCLYDVADQKDYNAGEFDQMKQVHDATTGSVAIQGTTWTYASGLATGTAGLIDADTLVLNETAGTGLTAAAATTPGTLIYGK